MCPPRDFSRLHIFPKGSGGQNDRVLLKRSFWISSPDAAGAPKVVSATAAPTRSFYSDSGQTKAPVNAVESQATTMGLKTALTDMLGIEAPIIQARCMHAARGPHLLVSCPPLGPHTVC